MPLTISAATVPIPVSADAGVQAKCTTISDFYAEAAAQDAADPLRHLRRRFAYPNNTLYFCGNSLGLQPHVARQAIEAELNRWATLAVHAHFLEPTPWADAERTAAEAVAPVVGAKGDEVALMNGLTVNLHLMMTAFYRPKGKRVRILVEDGAFSSDEYAIQTHVEARGMKKEKVIERIGCRRGETWVREEDLLERIREGGREGTLAMVVLPGVQYYTGQCFPMQEICRVGKEVGVIVGFDLAHAVGNVELELHEWGCDWAVWCSYKYLNGGPGAVAGCFVHERWGREGLMRLGGWWGHERASRFQMGREFVAEKGARGFQLSNPPIMGLVGVTASVGLIREAGGMSEVRRKSEKLTGLLERILRKRLEGKVEVVTPAERWRRGAQLSLRVKGLGGIGGIGKFNEILEDRGVVCDVREPDVLRVAPAPLYNSFEEVVKFVEVVENELRLVGGAQKTFR